MTTAVHELGHILGLSAGLPDFNTEISDGEYNFNIGTAGSTMLVLQTVIPPLLHADTTSRVYLTGGTHNPLCAPPEPASVLQYVPSSVQPEPQYLVDNLGITG